MFKWWSFYIVTSFESAGIWTFLTRIFIDPQDRGVYYKILGLVLATSVGSMRSSRFLKPEVHPGLVHGLDRGRVGLRDRKNERHLE
jgi:hypothetical protein